MDGATIQRREWLGILARSAAGQIEELLTMAGLAEDGEWLRGPEIGSVMVRGRAGGNGGAFNLGEMTITRCVARLACGTIGHGHVRGRRKRDAAAAALVDALMQTGRAAKVEAKVLVPLREAEAERRAARATRAAATKVDFFTLVRGED